eukprot:192741_1
MADKETEPNTKQPLEHDYLISTYLQHIERTLILSQHIADVVVKLITAFSKTAGIVIINGSGWTKAGFSSEDAPRSVFPNIIGTPRSAILLKQMDIKQYYVGYDAQAKRGILSLKHPVEFGVIQSFTDIERVWRYIFENELKTDPQGNNILIAECPLNPLANREKTTQIMFETFDVAGLYTIVGEVLSL